MTAQNDRLVQLRKALHACPELAFREQNTAGKISEFLTACGITVHRGIGGTGIVGVIEGQRHGRSIGLRADMDALPIMEKNTFPHCSQNNGAMHACGHDGHMVMLLGAAEILSAERDFPGKVHVIFQPAEEDGGGARAMLVEGLLQRFPMEMIFGMHNWPGLAAGDMAIHHGPVMASTDEFEIIITGKGGHAAMPHSCCDPVMAGAALVQALQTLISRNRSPLDPAVISVTLFHAGEAVNVIPQQAKLGGTVRTLSEQVCAQIQQQMQQVCSGISATYNVRAELRYKRGYPATINAERATQICLRAARSLGAEVTVHTDLQPSMGAEDFSFYLQQIPGCYVWIGNGPTEGGCQLHSPHYDFNDDIIATGVNYWLAVVRQALSGK